MYCARCIQAHHRCRLTVYVTQNCWLGVFAKGGLFPKGALFPKRAVLLNTYHPCSLRRPQPKERRDRQKWQKVTTHCGRRTCCGLLERENTRTDPLCHPPGAKGVCQRGTQGRGCAIHLLPEANPAGHASQTLFLCTRLRRLRATHMQPRRDYNGSNVCVRHVLRVCVGRVYPLRHASIKALLPVA